MDLSRSIEVAARWVASGERVASATLVRVKGPAPRPLGSRFLVTAGGDMEGSVSGGCVENDVFLHAQHILDSGGYQLVPYGITDEDAFRVGLSCGGEIEVFVEPWDDAVATAVAERELSVVATVIAGPHTGAKAVYGPGPAVIVGHVPEPLAGDLLPAIREALERELPSVVAAGESEVFVEVVAPNPRLVIFGAVEIGQALCALASRTGFSVTVCDPRGAFATAERFPDAASVRVGQPEDILDGLAVDDRTFVVVLSHDPRFEDPVVIEALAGNARYVGAMGSRSTHRKRLERLEAAGIPADSLARIHGPIGLDLGAVGAEETAVEILAEMVRARRSSVAG